MITVNASTFRKDLYNMLEQTVRYNEPLNVTTKHGNAVLLSEQDYNNMMETLYLESVPGMVDKILAAANEPEEDETPLSEVEW